MLLNVGAQFDSNALVDVTRGHIGEPSVAKFLYEAGFDLDLNQLLDRAIEDYNTDSISQYLFWATENSRAQLRPETLLEAAILLGDQQLASNVLTMANYRSRILCQAVIRCSQTKDFTIVNYLLSQRKTGPNDDWEVLAVWCAASNRDLELLETLMKVLGDGPWVTRLSHHLQLG
ncbi:hypothetical protein M406DRAFT_357303 [Cryphonectria parasitica EP155]|uniref:Uncharacterized protein n=1 Tax=Cryphonectria parasitica (strain ATCC 38755 / EP155) TaxID=660469 RepID=A0A9P4XZP7_CRYP1|nr:uncharacterized protein M406DRAFT_357303 [Cryphonectria parasitica EP155]KAF3763978.1 hypothetical protein M406DRAFT_357303 [Cryphonectria parasitica EP155]